VHLLVWVPVKYTLFSCVQNPVYQQCSTWRFSLGLCCFCCWLNWWLFDVIFVNWRQIIYRSTQLKSFIDVVQPTSTFSQPAPSDCSTVSMKHNGPLDLLCWGSVGLKLTACWTAWADCQLRWLSSHVKNYFIHYSRGTSVLSAIEMLCMRLRYINLIL